MKVDADAFCLVIGDDLVVPVAAVFSTIDVQSLIKDSVGDV